MKYFILVPTYRETKSHVTLFFDNDIRKNYIIREYIRYLLLRQKMTLYKGRCGTGAVELREWRSSYFKDDSFTTTQLHT